MTSDELIAEGRRLERPCFFLRPKGTGQIAGVWYERERGRVVTTRARCWLTVDAQIIPDLPPSIDGFISIFTGEEGGLGGRVEITQSFPERAGVPLYAHAASVLPPIDAVFARGSEAVQAWLRSHGWDPGDSYNDNFGDRTIAEPYQRIWFREFPIYLKSDIYAVLGGWHFSWPEGDWHDLIDERLMIFTIRASEPWIEVWQTRTGEFSVIQRIT
jgi:hypothetical protein